MSSVTTELQSCVFVARFLLSFSPLEKENSRKTAVIAPRPVTAAWEAPERSSLLPERWLPRSPLIDPPLGRLWREKTTCWLPAYNLLRSFSLWQPTVVYYHFYFFIFLGGCCEVQERPLLLEIGREECANSVKIRPCWWEIVTRKTGDDNKEINMPVFGLSKLYIKSTWTDNDARQISSVLLISTSPCLMERSQKRSHNETSAAASVCTQALLAPYIFLCTCCPLVLICYLV